MRMLSNDSNTVRDTQKFVVVIDNSYKDGRSGRRPALVPPANCT